MSRSRIIACLFLLTLSSAAQNAQLSLGVTNVTAGKLPYYVQVGDINGDGKPDIVSYNFGDFTLSVLLGNGDGTFQQPLQLPFTAVSNMVLGDFNGDGKLDIASVGNCNSSSPCVLVYPGKGDGTFGNLLSTKISVGQAIVVADFNGDGVLDIASEDIGIVAVVLGKGDGTFSAEKDLHVKVGEFNALSSGDYNRDGVIDLAVALSQNMVGIFLGNGDGTFQTTPIEYPAGNSPESIATADFNRDGKLDLAIADYGNPPKGGAVSVLLGNGDGTFRPGSVHEAFVGTLGFAAADFNGDGILDLVLEGFGRNMLLFLLGQGDGTFGADTFITVGRQPTALAVGDLDGDGLPDVVSSADDLQTVSVVGHGHAVLSRTLVDFGTVALGGTKSIPVTITNNGTTAFTVQKTQLMGENSQNYFHTFSCDGVTIDPGQSCTFKVGIAPTYLITVPATISITDDGAPGTQNISLYATVVSP